jgi:hypothetical protein
MKRLGLAVVLLAGALAPSPAGADPGHERPRITVMRWKEPPVMAGSGECDTDGICDEEILIIKAHDPDSSITEVQVWFDEGGDRAPFVYAHTYCVQGKKPGTAARLQIGATFTEPGTYTVAAVAYSHRRCLAHERGDRHPYRHSTVKRLETEVEETAE